MTDKKTQLAWLDKQRSIVNDMIVNLPPDEQGSLLPELQVINAIADRVREMTAVEYLEARNKMCAAYDGTDCRLCPMVDCRIGEKYNPRRAIEIVRKWKEKRDGKSV